MKRPLSAKTLSDVLTEAANLVKSLPSDLRATAFSKAVDLLMGGAAKVAAATDSPKEGGSGLRVHATESTSFDVIDSTAYPDIHRRTKVLDKVLLVFLAARESGASEWLSVGSVETILRQKFRIIVKTAAISMALSRASRLVDRKSIGHTYQYRLMTAGEEYLKGADSPAITKSKGASKAGKKLRNSKSPNAGKPTARGAVEELITAAFFREPRTLNEVGDHLAHRRGYRYKAGELSVALVRLVRSNQLEREKGKDGQFVYTATPKRAPGRLP